MRKNFAVIGLLVLLLLLVGTVFAWRYYQMIYQPNVPEQLSQEYLYIPTGASFEQVLDSLEHHNMLLDTTGFEAIASRMNYIKAEMRAGRYKIKGGWSNYALIRHLRGVKQATVKVVLNNERLPENVAAKAARFLEADSIAILDLMQDEAYLATIGYTPETLMSLFIPNTYDFYWNSSPEAFMERMIKEHDRFWDSNGRKRKANKREMTPAEVYTLASIVERETLRGDEKKRMAGVYLNRLKTGMLLQADPTAVFGRRDFGAKRVTWYHTKFDSPYNTYMYAGLPPGPISMASISSIDAVLNAEAHDYLFFCAKGDGSGYHNFAKSLAQHNENRKIYVKNLKKRGKR
ncbi:MAG: endolytic transglycosylase MltG [Bacteroidota bacterium]